MLKQIKNESDLLLFSQLITYQPKKASQLFQYEVLNHKI